MVESSGSDAGEGTRSSGADDDNNHSDVGRDADGGYK